MAKSHKLMLAIITYMVLAAILATLVENNSIRLIGAIILLLVLYWVFFVFKKNE